MRGATSKHFRGKGCVMRKIKLVCWTCKKEYESVPLTGPYKCECGGYVVSPSGKIQGRWEEDKNQGGFETTWNEFVENWSKFQKDWEGYIGQGKAKEKGDEFK